jgi:nucleotide-binding universal stress UspA family protein
MVPKAGGIIVIWLAIGGGLYWFLFARRAQVFDASREALNPELITLRGRSPLILVPIANPENAEAMIATANALAPPTVGRMLLLSVVAPPAPNRTDDLSVTWTNVQSVLGKSLSASLSLGAAPEVLTTIAKNPWEEISRVAKLHRCESLLLGFSEMFTGDSQRQIEALINSALCDVVILKAPRPWQFNQIRRILVPIGGRSGHAELRARFLSSLCRSQPREITYLQVIPEDVTETIRQKVAKDLYQFAQDEINVNPQAEVVLSNTPAQVIVEWAREADLILVGMHRAPTHRHEFGQVIFTIARDTACGLIVINQSP